jgi:hypothetical protein
MDKIFDKTKAIEEYDRNARTYLNWVQPTEIRSLVLKTHEVQVEMAKLASSTLTKAFSYIVPTSK